MTIMKSALRTFIGAAAVTFAALALCSCGSGNKKASVSEIPAEEQETIFTAINDFLSNKIAPDYREGEVTIPCYTIVGKDESNPDDIRVWGDYWVYNYDVAGDTLKTVSGGSHPGLMHIKKTGDKYEVTLFDQVEDGSRYLPTAKEIFGEMFEDFQKISSDDKERDRARTEAISGYVRSKGLNVKMYKDFGWDPVTIQ